MLILSLSSFKIEIAEEPHELMKGLMYRDSIDDETAMLFKFPNKRFVSLWMYNVKFDIDVAFLDDQFKILEIRSLKAYPEIKEQSFFFEKKIKSNFYVQYALEANKGFFERHQLKVGDVIPLN